MTSSAEQASNSSTLAEALRVIAHRGPDNTARWQSTTGDVQVGHVRLSIIDPTENANQPMLSDDGRYVLVFNGEIYNFRDLYAKYLSSVTGVNPRSDTSVLFHLLLAIGAEAIPLLNGMFSFVLIDTRDKNVLMARDRFGEKPLLYMAGRQQFCFASELKALRQLQPDRRWALDSEALQLYFMTGTVPAPKTIYADVQALLPGELLRWQAGGVASIERYWHLADAGAVTSASKPPVDTVREMLSQAVQSRMISDVPVGIFLSGGLDSSSIVTTAAAQRADIESALCIDFPEQRYSESSIARSVADQFGIKFHREVVDKSDFLAEIPAFFSAMDQPTVDGFNTYFVARAAARTGIKVWLSGVGGDELFGGYPSFTRMGRLEKLSKALQLFVPSLLAGLAPRAVGFPRATRFLHLGVSGNSTHRAYQVCRTAILPALCERLIADGRVVSRQNLQSLLDGMASEPPAGLDGFQRASLMESSLYLANQLLRDIDNFSMAKSIEIRAPFLDHRLFEGVWPLPAKFKTYNSTVKPLLIDSVPGGLPDSVPTRAKQGFTFPMQEWLRQDMEAQFREVVLDGENDDIWDRSEVEKLWQMYRSARVGWLSIWSFFVFASWRRTQSC